MKTVRNMTVEELLRRQAALRAELALVEPVLMKELDAVEEQLSTLRSAQGKYTHVHTVIDAVVMELKQQKRGLTKQELTKALLDGGYYAGKSMSRYMIRDAVNYHVKKGRLREVNGLITLAETV